MWKKKNALTIIIIDYYANKRTHTKFSLWYAVVERSPF